MKIDGVMDILYGFSIHIDILGIHVLIPHSYPELIFLKIG
jgi:hypothetical protein